MKVIPKPQPRQPLTGDTFALLLAFFLFLMLLALFSDIGKRVVRIEHALHLPACENPYPFVTNCPK